MAETNSTEQTVTTTNQPAAEPAPVLGQLNTPAQTQNAETPPAQTTTTTTTAEVPTDWRKHIPEEYREAKFWEKHKEGDEGLATVVKNYAEQQKLIGSKYTIPETGDAEGWGQLYNQLGRPATAEGYEIKYPDHHPVLDWNADAQKEVSGMAHDLGLSNSQYQRLVDWYSRITVEGQEFLDQKNAEALGELRASYGALADRKFMQADNLLRRAGGDELLEVIRSSGLSGHPVFVGSMVRLVEQMGEDSTVVTQVGGLTSREEAISRIKEIRRDKEHPYYKGDPEAVEEMQRLYQLAENEL